MYVGDFGSADACIDNGFGTKLGGYRIALELVGRHSSMRNINRVAFEKT